MRRLSVFLKFCDRHPTEQIYPSSSNIHKPHLSTIASATTRGWSLLPLEPMTKVSNCNTSPVLYTGIRAILNVRPSAMGRGSAVPKSGPEKKIKLRSLPASTGRVSSCSGGGGRNVDVGAILPDLGRLLAVPARCRLRGDRMCDNVRVSTGM